MTAAARKRQTEPFFMVPKRAMLAIREKVEGTDQAFCSAVYVALRWKANDGTNHDGPFSAAINDIAGRAGCSYRKAADSLGVLASIGVVAIEPQFCENKKTRSPSVYTFPPLDGTPLRTMGGTPCAQDEGSPVPRLEKEQKEPKEPILAPNGASEFLELKTKPTAHVPKPRPRDLSLEALAAIGGSDLTQVTQPAWRSAAAALKTIRAVCPGVTSEQIQLRGRHYQQVFPSATLTAHALAKHWATCERPPSPAGPAPTPQRNYQPISNARR